MNPTAFFTAMALAALSLIPATNPASAQRQTVIETINCESINRQRQECRVRGRITDVQPVVQFTAAPCVQNSTWGFNRRSVWVDKGCQAQFNVEVSRREGGGRANEANEAGENFNTTDGTVTVQGTTVEGVAYGETVTETVDCRSRRFNRKECPVPGKITNVETVGTFSLIRCRLSETWGSEDGYIWVDRGCQARFNVTYVTPGNPAPEPTPEPSAPDERPSLASAPLQAVLAQGACTGLYPTKRGSKGGFVFAVPRACTQAGPDCASVCNNLDSTMSRRLARKTTRNRSLSCFNSIHVYDKGPAGSVGAAGTQTYVYNSCGGGCGPNYCCCGAE